MYNQGEICRVPSATGSEYVLGFIHDRNVLKKITLDLDQ